MHCGHAMHYRGTLTQARVADMLTTLCADCLNKLGVRASLNFEFQETCMLD